MFQDGGRKPEYPERTHVYTGRTCKLTQKGPSWELNLEPSCCEVMLLTTSPPCSPHLQIVALKRFCLKHGIYLWIFAGVICRLLLDWNLLRDQTVRGHHHIIICQPEGQIQNIVLT